MDDVNLKLRKRLKYCFAGTFPDIPSDAIADASMNNTEGWDSMKTWILLMVVQEEFGITIGQDQIPKLTSFALFEAHVAKKVK